MATWFHLDLGDGVDAFTPTSRIQEAWLAATLAAAKRGKLDHGNAVFSTTSTGAQQVIMYFTPSASALATAFGATPCEKPVAERIGLICGDQRAWDIHFPERKR